MIKLLKQISLAGIVLLCLISLAGCGKKKVSAEVENMQVKPNGKILVAYYSQGGHTRAAAEDFAKMTGADLFEIKPQHPYPAAHDPCLAQQMDDLKKDARPAVAGKVDNMDQYAILFIGYPIWYYVEPMVVDTFLESYDLKGKTVIPFCTSGGYPITDSVARVKKAAPGANVLNGLRANSASDRKAYVKQLSM